MLLLLIGGLVIILVVSCLNLRDHQLKQKVWKLEVEGGSEPRGQCEGQDSCVFSLKAWNHHRSAVLTLAGEETTNSPDSTVAGGAEPMWAAMFSAADGPRQKRPSMLHRAGLFLCISKDLPTQYLCGQSRTTDYDNKPIWEESEVRSRNRCAGRRPELNNIPPQPNISSAQWKDQKRNHGEAERH